MRKLTFAAICAVGLTFAAGTVFAAGIFAAAASAGSQPSALVAHVQGGQAIPGGAGPFFIYFAANNTNAAACATSKNVFSIDPTTDQGRVAISVVMAAYIGGKTVWATGAGTCNLYNGVEDLSNVYIN